MQVGQMLLLESAAVVVLGYDGSEMWLLSRYDGNWSIG